MFFIKAADGTRLAVYDLHPCGCRTAVLLHGWPLSHKMFEYQAGQLVRQGCRVVAMDMRGFGNSGAPAEGYSYNQMADDLYAVIAGLRLGSFVLAGFSMGGAVALRYMRRYGGYGVKKLILLAAAAPYWTQRPGFPYGLPDSQAAEIIRQAMTDRPMMAHEFVHKQLFACPHSEAVKDWFERIACSASGIGTVEAVQAMRQEEGMRDLQSVRAETVIIHGKKDTVVSSQLAAIQKQQIPGARLYELERSGHGIVYDELEVFNRIFIKEVLGEGGQEKILDYY